MSPVARMERSVMRESRPRIALRSMRAALAWSGSADSAVDTISLRDDRALLYWARQHENVEDTKQAT